jgi:hypothetical protein
MQEDITHLYSQWTFVHDNQIHAIEIKDPSWRSRNNVHLVKPVPAVSLLDPLTVECSSLKKLDADYLGSGLIDIVSNSLAEFLKPRIRAEFIPVNVLHNGQPYDGHPLFLMHLLDQFPAMDLEKSDYTEWDQEAGGGIDRIAKLVLKVAAIGDSPAFILHGIPLLCVRNDLVQGMKNAGFKGLKFNSLDTYQNVRPRR